ncbi:MULTISPECIES: NADH-quinone oxidoreductase subunit NuoE [Streptomyces]|uniref:NADH-quinone oxidoreductase subunit E n=1 Tax=Streptomyces avermitilis (strain ATCC 31267 / DSM 46492 / JCM 5070 / NBRC 14893 / NCIMB 12804 / NRRL 8165 / MA-4680) TaxID=227882 RepID=Q82DX7_STRAW|nr:NADH-quinone oxidoreductase subunit NuoE [Streptomyces avermitilis]MYT00424.1 NADH-quinone oxidoreductase subunit NuoE [Streptomyces sp. SID5469]KUN52536.1 NADH dehydrogenase [Streptomyces avermitilis]OOV31401.1 NADH-quinone oxidoreductase subunit E [Streptomyces avermitilis]BAC72553.1 putative NADH dehydrogenase I chain E (complex I) [Streptomyces avermitilis MA-4680 = NBRC 14893]GDY83897.1 NADH-quinone oxidoreductase subunit E [Streptomyces avermitilis]
MTTSSSEQGVSLGMPRLPAPDYPDDVRARLERDGREIIARYPDSRSALLPLLHLVQAEEGHVTRTGMQFCADILGLTTAEVTAVATFYTMYRRRPSGDYQVGVCTNTLCAVMGGDAIFSALQDHLGVGNGETTDDGKVTLEHIECNAACDFAPVVMVNWEFFDNQTVASAKRLVDDLRAGAPVEPTRGAPLCTFKDTARILAGFPDERDGAVEASGSAGPASLTGLRLAKGESAPARVVHPRGSGAPQDEPPHEPSPAEHLSSHDAPQDTSDSDPSHPAGPVAEEGE